MSVISTMKDTSSVNSSSNLHLIIYSSPVERSSDTGQADKHVQDPLSLWTSTVCLTTWDFTSTISSSWTWRP